ncbi:F-box protein [Actinidia chinensis var. chinensis]|uniref:F-box protein n=1 Tax=Actinidia chinensis var. chinensis TaxID=1590841 RepID=A0A2R6PFJ7_ACTCC|nr:F-box protein [Actinidia chinensis var. chinensis]
MEETNNNSCQLEEQGIITSPQTSEIMEDLPLDIVFNILSWTPVKSLLQWRSVSKLWRCIIDHPFFADMHISRGNEEPNMLLLSPYPNWRRTKLSFRLVEEGGRTLKGIERSVTEFDLINQCRLMGSCNGLLCFVYNNEESYILLNPFRKEHVALPEATIKAYPVTVSCGLGFHSSTNTYKVVRLVTPLRLPTLVSRVEVHKVGTSSWREITEVPPCLLHRNPVFAHGALHWLVTPFIIFLTYDESFVEHLGKIVSFDVGKEKFNLTPHPSSHSKNVHCLSCLM